MKKHQDEKTKLYTTFVNEVKNKFFTRLFLLVIMEEKFTQLTFEMSITWYII